jgi:hypothetical protein
MKVLPAYVFLLFGLHCISSFERGIGNFQTNQEGTGTTVAKDGAGGLSNMEEFEALLAELDRLNHERRLLHARDENGLPSHPLNVAYRAALEADWRAANPKKKLPKNDAKLFDGAPNAQRILSEHSEAADHWVNDNIYQPLAQTETALCAAAVGLPVPPADEWQQIGDVWESTYRSQSYGASKYANAKAHLIADKAVFYGVEASVEGYEFGYRVKARTTPTGAEILRRKPDVPVKEWVEACARRGVNPRVYNPFLPYEVDA